jgi:hypothetical protein
MSEMIERVAKAIWEANHGYDGGLAQARAAIAAMREPTEEMITAGEHAYLPTCNFEAVYHAMIDAALAEKTETK